LAATPYDALIRIEGIPAVSGPTSLNAILLDGVSTASYEGIWFPWLFVKQGSLELSGTSTFSLTLWGTNALAPLNSYAFTIAGSTTNLDILQINFATPFGVHQAFYQTVTSDTPTIQAAGLAANINSTPAFAAMGFQASNLAGVLTVSWPSVSPASAGQYFTTSSPGIAQVVNVTTAVTGGATETIATAVGVGGSAIAATLAAATSSLTTMTAPGLYQFTASARWIKVRLTSVTGNLTAVAQGTA
jgi:hypothetical protein